VSGVVQFQKAARRLRAQPASSLLVNEIVDALHYLGGQAHRSMVIQCIAAVRRNNGDHAPEDLDQELIAAFHEHLASRKPPLLALPFGPESLRWGLSAEGAAQMRHKMRML
jgi:hypothetical protein